MTTITEAIISGNLVDAKNQICETLNEHALAMLDELKSVYASHMFLTTEEINAKFKGNTEMDAVKDAKANGEDVGEDVPDKDEDKNDADGEDANDDEGDEGAKFGGGGGGDKGGEDNKEKTIKAGKNITVNIKEDVLNELSPVTLASYTKKAIVGTAKGKKDRAEGINTAVSNLVKKGALYPMQGTRVRKSVDAAKDATGTSKKFAAIASGNVYQKSYDKNVTKARDAATKANVEVAKVQGTMDHAISNVADMLKTRRQTILSNLKKMNDSGASDNIVASQTAQKKNIWKEYKKAKAALGDK
jgi:hypothetical protein